MPKYFFWSLIVAYLLTGSTPIYANDNISKVLPIEKLCIPFKENQILFLRGDIAMSATTERSEGQPPHTYFLFLLEEPICPDGDQRQKIDRIEVYPMDMKWLGHYVEIRGTIIAGDAWSIGVLGTRDAKSH